MRHLHESVYRISRALAFLRSIGAPRSSIPARGGFVGMKTGNSQQSLDKNKENHSIFRSAPLFPVLRLCYPKLRSFSLGEIYSRMCRGRVLGKTVHSLRRKRMQAKRRSKNSPPKINTFETKHEIVDGNLHKLFIYSNAFLGRESGSGDGIAMPLHK